jgi:hypothetical protein
MRFDSVRLESLHFEVYCKKNEILWTCQDISKEKYTYCMFISSPSKSALYGGVLSEIINVPDSAGAL